MSLLKEEAKIQAEIDANWRKINHMLNQEQTKMEKNNFYPLRVGKMSTIVSTINPHPRIDNVDENEFYKGYVVARDVPMILRHQLVDAYNEKYAPKSEDSFEIWLTKYYSWNGVGWVTKTSPFASIVISTEGLYAKFTERMDIGRKTNCTQPDCDCVEQAEKKAGGPVKSYPCLARDTADEMKAKKPQFEPFKPTVNEQIDWLQNQLNTKELGAAGDFFHAIIKNLRAIRRWNESPVYDGDIDVAKVIEDLIAMIIDYGMLLGLPNSSIDCKVCIQSGKRAIDMINVFKEEREAGMAPRQSPPEWVNRYASITTKPLTPEDVAEAHQAGLNIFDKKEMGEYAAKKYPHIPQSDRDELVNDITEMLPFDRNIARKTANTIVTAIESMDTLKRKHGR